MVAAEPALKAQFNGRGTSMFYGSRLNGCEILDCAATSYELSAACPASVSTASHCDLDRHGPSEHSTRLSIQEDPQECLFGSLEHRFLTSKISEHTSQSPVYETRAAGLRSVRLAI